MFDKNYPFLATITSRHILSRPGSKRHTYHIELSIEGSGLHYAVGDSVGIIATNDPLLVAKTIAAMKATGEELIKDRKTGELFPLTFFLTHKANIGQFSRRLIQEVAERQPDNEKKEQLLSLLNHAHHEALKAYQEQHHLWDFLQAHAEAIFSAQDLCSLLMPLLPRLYSIASARQVVGNAIDLTVSHLIYQSSGHDREGVATSFLCRRAPLNEPLIPIYIQPHHGFTLPDQPEAAMIMVGPGTGIAPFRAFMQQRLHENAAGANWLFFGEWQAAYDFYYEEFWPTVSNLKVDTAFSRDQAHKIYVQDRMLEQSAELYAWIEKGAYLYVCGDAQRMAKDVDATLHKILEQEGKMTANEAKLYVKQMRADKRYLRDIY